MVLVPVSKQLNNKAIVNYTGLLPRLNFSMKSWLSLSASRFKNLQIKTKLVILKNKWERQRKKERKKKLTNIVHNRISENIFSWPEKFMSIFLCCLSFSYELNVINICDGIGIGSIYLGHLAFSWCISTSTVRCRILLYMDVKRWRKAFIFILPLLCEDN